MKPELEFFFLSRRFFQTSIKTRRAVFGHEGGAFSLFDRSLDTLFPVPSTLFP